MKLLQLLILATFGVCLASATIQKGNKCDEGFFYRGSNGEISRDCWSECYYNKYKCGDIQCSSYLGDNCMGRRNDCGLKCNAECNRCTPEGYNQHAITPSCPKPQCLVQTVDFRSCSSNCGGLSKAVQNALTAKYKRLKLSTGVPGANDICRTYCSCKVYGPRSFPWHGESLCANLSPLPQRSLRSAPLYDFDDDEQYVGGGKVYGEYNKGPVRAGGEWEFDEEDQSVGWDDQPSHTRPHMPDNKSMGNWINFRI